jgi:hypothetical protein
VTGFGKEASAQLHRLLRQYARTVAHEANNLIFLGEIAAKTGTQSPESVLAGLQSVARRARVVAQALAPDTRRRATGVRELADNLSDAVARQSSLGSLLQLEVVPEALPMSFRERPGHAQLLLHHLLEECALFWGVDSSTDPLLAMTVRAAPDAAIILVAPLADRALPSVTPLASEICALNGFRFSPEADGQWAIRLPRAD